MKKYQSILSLFCFVAFFSILVSSCASNDTTDIDPNLNTRNLMQKVSAKAYHYKNLASFAKGKAEMQLTDLAQLQGKQVNLILLYEASAPWADNFDRGEYSITGNDILDGLLKSYNLEITQQFAIDEENEGIVIESKTALDSPIEAARQLSLVDHVLMVHLKEVPSNENAEDTADK